MKRTVHICSFWILIFLSSITLAQPASAPLDEMSFKTSDWIDTDKVDDYLHAEVTVKKIAPDIFQVNYKSDGSFSDNAASYDATAFAYFNFCVGDYLAARSGSRYWRLGADAKLDKLAAAGPELNMYVAVLGSKEAATKPLKNYDIDWPAEDRANPAGAFKTLCSQYLRTQYVDQR